MPDSRNHKIICLWAKAFRQTGNWAQLDQFERDEAPGAEEGQDPLAKSVPLEKEPNFHFFGWSGVEQMDRSLVNLEEVGLIEWVSAKIFGDSVVEVSTTTR